MSDSLHIVVDTSGSMKELTKRFIAADLVRYVRGIQILRPELFAPFALRLFAWGEKVEEIPLSPDEDIALPDPAGKANIDELSRFLESQGPIKALILTDSFSGGRKFPLAGNPDGRRFAILAVGADSRCYANERTDHLGVFKAFDISAALDFLLTPRDGSKPPNSIDQIQIASETKNGEDDWAN